MNPRDQVDALDHAGLDDSASAAGWQLLGVLKHEPDLAGKLVAPFAEDLSGTEKHRRVAVVPARVHHPGSCRHVRDVVLLDDRQRVHVGPQHDHLPRPGAVQPRDDGRSGRPLDLEPAERAQRLLDERGRLVLLERQLGVRMEMAAPGDRAGLEIAGDEP